jgi:predicted phage-related endonuclease
MAAQFHGGAAMSITYHRDLIQGSESWHQSRCGLITASEVRLLLTPTLKAANNDKSRAHIWELAAQRITQYVEPSYVSDAMLRGHEDEIRARDLYRKHIAPVEEVGFVTNDRWGFTLGCSPDGLVGADGMIECKSRAQKYQVQTIVEHWRDGTAPDDYILQVQTAMLVTERKWCDLISYSGGLPMIPMRIEADPVMQEAIVSACEAAEARIAEIIADFGAAVEARGLIPTERHIEQEMWV